MTTKVYSKKMGEGAKEQDWLKTEVFDKLREHGANPFMVVGFKDFDDPTKTVPLAGFLGNDLGDLLMLIAEACDMLSQMYKKADSLTVLEAVRKVLELRIKTKESGKPCSMEDVMSTMGDIIEQFGSVDIEGATLEE